MRTDKAQDLQFDSPLDSRRGQSVGLGTPLITPPGSVRNPIPLRTRLTGLFPTFVVASLFAGFTAMFLRIAWNPSTDSYVQYVPIGAVFAAMNTMYASVGARTREIGTLRVVGYRRRTILASFIIEGAILATIGGVLGCLLSFPMHGYSTGTMSFDSFSEVIFQFRITPWLVTKGIVFSIIIGVVGSLLPAIRASRLPVIAALKAV